MSQSKPLKHLEETFRELSSELEVLNTNAVRNRKFDFPVIAPQELTPKLQSIKKTSSKIHLLLNQIGYLRINIFQEYYERIQAAIEKKDYNQALQLMNIYIETIAMPFLQHRLHPSTIDKLIQWFSSEKTLDTANNLQEWKKGYESWLKQESCDQVHCDQKELNEFNQLKKLFFTLYTLSFSFENFPSVATEPTH